MTTTVMDDPLWRRNKQFIRRNKNLSNGAKVLAYYLIEWTMNHDDGKQTATAVEISINHMSRMTGKTRVTIRRQLDALLKAGYEQFVMKLLPYNKNNERRQSLQKERQEESHLLLEKH